MDHGAEGDYLKPVQRAPTRQQTRALYDGLARWYDYLGSAAEKKIALKALGKLNILPGERVCEIGFGTGHGLEKLAHLVGETGRVYGVDLSPKMAIKTRDRIRSMGLAPRVFLAQGDTVELPFVCSSFSALFLSFTLELFPDVEIPQVLQECRRVLHPSGRLGLVFLSKNGSDRGMRRIYEWAHRHFPYWIDCRPIYAHQALADAGFFIEERSLESLWGLPVEIVIAWI